MPQLMPAEPSMLGRLLDRTRKNRTKTDTKTDTETKLLPPSKKPDLTGLLDPNRNRKKLLDFPPFPTPSGKDKPKTQPEGGGGDGGKNNIVGTGAGDGGKKKPSAFSTIQKFARRNPAASLAGYDLGKGILGKIMKARVPNVPTPRAIRVSAKS